MIRSYAEAAECHRPADAEAIAREIRRLAAAGWSSDDIARVMRLHPKAVEAALVAGARAA